MTTPTEQLYLTLTPEQIDDYCFRAPPGDQNMLHMFGGQVLAQALNATSRTVPEGRHAHSVHAYFLRSGDVGKPIDFFVESLRDGGSFSTRHVVAKQEGKAIFDASLSFKPLEPGHTHQPEAPEVPPPDSFQNDVERREKEGLSLAYTEINPFSVFDIRTVGPMPDEFTEGDDERQGLWIKAANPTSDTLLMQQCLIAYVSDFRLLCSAMKPHGIKFWAKNVLSASLDHALWFHRPFKFDEWFYYDLTGPVAGDARGLNFGRIYDSSGRIIASTAQEGLMRVS